MRIRQDIVLCQIVLMLILLTPGRLPAQIAPPDITITPKQVGSGARALGQSAFIAVADDATAASWNPAGLIQLEKPELSFVGAWQYNINHFSSGTSDIRIGQETWQESEINFASIAWPFTVANKDVVVSLNYHRVYDFGLDLNFDQIVRGTDSVLPLNLDVESEGSIYATSLAGGISITPSLTFGAALNFHQDIFCDNTLQVNTHASGEGTLAGSPAQFRYHSSETFDDFCAINATFGLLWDVWKKDEKRLTLGGVLHTPFTADMDRKIQTTSILNGQKSQLNTRENFEIDFPLSVGAGCNYRISDVWSVAGDLQWTQWSEFEQKDARGSKSAPVGGVTSGNIDDTFTQRIGTEYLILSEDAVLALRAGLFHEQRPALGDSMDLYGFSLGTGWTNEQFSLDFAYQFRQSEDISGRNIGLSGATDFNAQEHWFITSLIIYF